jgi:hypothetical protein
VTNPSTDDVLLFGGGLFDPFFGDTWTWDGSQWSLRHPSISPSPRGQAAAVYDPNSQSVVLFGGGNSSGSLADTWTWDGSTWSQQQPTTSPSARQDAAMAFDPATGQLVLFGGNTVVGNMFAYSNDTWTWDGSNWTEQHPLAPPAGRDGATLIYDPASGRLLLFGGDTLNSLMQDTWAWDGSQWTQLSPLHSPPARFHAASFHDPASGEPVVFAGFGTSGSHYLDDTWAWNGSDWAQVDTPVHPYGRQGAGIADGTAATPPLLFGGDTISAFYLSDSWVWAATSQPVQLNAVVSGKVHGMAGTFDIDLPLTGSPGIECRSGGANGDYTMVFTFANGLTNVASASVTNGSGSVTSNNIDSNDARNYIVNLTGVTNAQVITVSLANVTDSAGGFSSTVSAQMGVLLGDVDASGRVDAADVSLVRQQTLQPITSANFREDINASGRIDAADVSIVRQQTLTSLP